MQLGSIAHLFVHVITTGVLCMSAIANDHVLQCKSSEYCLILQQNFSKEIRLSQTPDTIIIGNNQIVDASIIKNNLLVLSPMSVGETNLVALDDKGDEILRYTLQVLKEKPAHNIRLISDKKETLYKCVDSGSCAKTNKPPSIP